MGNRKVVERYAAAIAANDFDGQVALLHDDYVMEFPQSGERFRGRDQRRAVFEGYPGREESGQRPNVTSISGTDDQILPRPSWPAFTAVYLAGSGDEFAVTGTIRYPDGELWHFVSLLTLLEGAIWRETVFWGQPFEAPDWRASMREAP